MKLRRIGLVALIAFGAGAIVLSIFSVKWWNEGKAMASAHELHLVSHPGWSFPARVKSRALQLTAPPEHLVAHARALDYVEDCSVADPPPGSFCAKTMKVTPRSGAELEAVVLGWLIGPDAEVREHLPLEEAPKHLIDAIIVSEDRDS